MPVIPHAAFWKHNFNFRFTQPYFKPLSTAPILQLDTQGDAGEGGLLPQ